MSSSVSTAVASSSVYSNAGFDSPISILATSQDSLRRARIYSVLTTYGGAHNDVLSKIANIWKDIASHLTPTEFRSPIEKGLAEIVKINPSLKTAYVLDVGSYEKAVSSVRQFCEDRLYLSQPLVIRSSGGYRGTLIVNNPVLDGGPKDYVFKWADKQEVDSTRVYQCFSKYMPHIFSVPNLTAVDLKKKTFSSAEVPAKPIESNVFEQLHANYADLTRLVVKDKAGSESVNDTLENGEFLMFADKVPGASLHDFITSKYEEMDDASKRVLFEKLGSLCLLDLALHFDDRIKLIKYEEEEQKYLLACQNSASSSDHGDINFGNFIVDWKVGGKPILYAIDNGFEKELTKTDIKAYMEFLAELCTSKTGFAKLSQEMVGAFVSTLSEEGDDSEDEGLASGEQKFVDDLNKFGAKAFENGIAEMYRNLRNYFNQIIAKDLTIILADSPQLIGALAARGELFK